MTERSHPVASHTRNLPALADATALLTSWVEVDLAAQSANVAALKVEFGADVELIAVVKANAYGAGIEGVAPTLEASAGRVVRMDHAPQFGRPRLYLFRGTVGSQGE